MEVRRGRRAPRRCLGSIDAHVPIARLKPEPVLAVLKQDVKFLAVIRDRAGQGNGTVDHTAGGRDAQVRVRRFGQGYADVSGFRGHIQVAVEAVDGEDAYVAALHARGDGGFRRLNEDFPLRAGQRSSPGVLLDEDITFAYRDIQIAGTVQSFRGAVCIPDPDIAGGFLHMHTARFLLHVYRR